LNIGEYMPPRRLLGRRATAVAVGGCLACALAVAVPAEVRPEYGRNGPRTLGEARYAERHPVGGFRGGWV
jgi:hypothetical protein